MSFFIRTVVIITFLTSSLDVFGHDGSSPEKSTNDVKILLDQFHHDIEHGLEDETKSKLASVLSQWLNNFNLLRISTDTHRFTQMKYYQDSGKNEYIKNFPVLASFYFLSHAIEVFSGPIGVYVASDLGLGNTAKVIIGSVGAIISIPGLDPLCILLFSVSPLKPMQKMMTNIRLVTVKLAKEMSNKFQLKNAAQKLFQNKDRLTEIVNNNSDVSLRSVFDTERDILLKQLVVKSPEGKSYLVLNFQKNWVDSLQVLDAEVLARNKNNLDKILSEFNWSARYALKEALKTPRKTFYMDSIEVKPSETNIQFKSYGVVLKPKVRLNTQFQFETKLCKNLFQ